VDLKTFVTETIAEIVEGVQEAQARVADTGALVNPSLANEDGAAKAGLINAWGAYAQMVKFDVALTATEGTGTKGGIGVVVGGITLGSSGQSKTESSAVSRVQFVVPITLPSPKKKK
jgi:hypothetical protein